MVYFKLLRPRKIMVVGFHETAKSEKLQKNSSDDNPSSLGLTADILITNLIEEFDVYFKERSAYIITASAYQVVDADVLYRYCPVSQKLTISGFWSYYLA